MEGVQLNKIVKEFANKGLIIKPSKKIWGEDKYRWFYGSLIDVLKPYLLNSFRKNGRIIRMYHLGKIHQNLNNIISAITKICPYCKPLPKQKVNNDDLQYDTHVFAHYGNQQPSYDENTMNQASQELLDNDNIGPHRFGENLNRLLDKIIRENTLKLLRNHENYI